MDSIGSDKGTMDASRAAARRTTAEADRVFSSLKGAEPRVHPRPDDRRRPHPGPRRVPGRRLCWRASDRPDGTVYTRASIHVYAFFGPAPPEPDFPWPIWRHDAERTGWAR